MIIEAGNGLLCLALGVALLLALYPLLGAMRQDERFMALSRLFAWLLLVCVAGACLILVHAFVVNDFSVAYVARHSSTRLPLGWRIAATWGAHEGSLLLWLLLMSGWIFALATCSRRTPLPLLASALAVMGMVSAGFVSFILFTSNPFTRTLPDFPIEGNDLNPLLQDPGLFVHPPLLYMGYVGFSVAFAFAVAALLRGELNSAWARLVRPWVLIAWVFLTLGIVFGSLWAYSELGWGGWWFWDPVENASLMPWLSGTALLHSLAVTARRQNFKIWTLLLAILTFSLCLVATFLVRSGLLVSVHAFAADPVRGVWILAFMLLNTGGALLLFALRAGRIRSVGNPALWSRESFLLANNVLLMSGVLVVLLGTLVPLVHHQLGLGRISIGEPFFNRLFTALMVPFSLLLGIGPLVRWGRDRPARYRRLLLLAVLSSFALALLLPWWLQDRLVALAVAGLVMALWVIILAVGDGVLHVRQGLRITPRLVGRTLAHVGLAVTVVGITFSHNYALERDVRLQPGDSVLLRDYRFHLRSVMPRHGPNWQGVVVEFDVSRAGQPETILRAEKRHYLASGQTTTEAAMGAGITRDLYVALGQELEEGAWAVRLFYKPFIRWIWAGGLMMALGGALSLLTRRSRVPEAT